MVGRYRETLGQYLRRERESRTMSLEELSKATRIGLPYLEALERDDFNFFPQREFIRGFLKGYARQLGLNLEEVLGRYRVQSELMSRKETFQQMPLFPGTVEPETEPPEAKPEILETSQPGRPKSRYWRISAQIIIVSLALSLSWYIHRLLKDSTNGEKSPPPQVTSSAKKKTESAAASAVAEGNRRAPVKEKARITGDRTKKVYYLPGMKGAEKVSPVHRVEFDSEGEASKAGYRRAPP
jgi:cytoskeletal protein RodZ